MLPSYSAMAIPSSLIMIKFLLGKEYKGVWKFLLLSSCHSTRSVESEVDVVLWLFSEQHLYYVFCLLKLDGQVLDTALVETDESETDVSFDNVIVL